MKLNHGLSVLSVLLIALLTFFYCGIVSAESYSHFFSVARDSAGNSLESATVAVYESGTTNLVSIYSDSSSTIKPNPFLTDSQGNYGFFVSPGLYKIVVTKVEVGTFTVDEVSIGTQLHASSHSNTGTDPLVITSAMISDGSIVNSDISDSAAIAESKLSLNYATHSNNNDPTTDQKAALAGSSGAPSAGNKYVTNNDSRLSNSRTPVVHASTHSALGSDPLSLASSQLTGVNPGTDLTADLEEEGHATEHENGGNDELSVSGLSGVLADIQKIGVLVNGSAVGTRSTVNFLDGTNVSVVGTDNSGNNRVDIEFSVPGNPEIAFWDKDAFGTPSLLTSPTSKVTLGYGLSGSSTGNEVEFLVDRPAVSLEGDVTGTLDASVVSKIQGLEVSGNPPSSGDLMEWSSDHSMWEPKPQKSNVSIWIEGDLFDSNTTIIDFGPEFPMSLVEPGHVSISFDISQAASVPATSIRTKEIDSTLPSDGQVLKYSSSSGKWEPSSDIAGQTLAVYDDLGASITDPTEGLTFDVGFDVTEKAANQAKITLDLSEVDVVANYLKTTSSGHPASVLIDYSSLNSGDMLSWNGSNWDAVAPPATDIIVDYQTNGGLRRNERHVNYLVFSDAFVGAETTDPTYGIVFTLSTTMDKIPNGTSYKKMTTTQVNDLTDNKDSTLHYHSSDRDLSNATGTLDDARLGDIKTQTKSIVIPYPIQNKGYGFLYIPSSVTVTTIASRSRGATCTINVKDDGTSVLSSDLVASTTGATTSSITNPNVDSGSWLEFYVGASCGSSVTEVTINMVYTVN